MASLIIMLIVGIVALAIAVVPVTFILWQEAHAPSPLDAWLDQGAWRLEALELAGGAAR